MKKFLFIIISLVLTASCSKNAMHKNYSLNQKALATESQKAADKEFEAGNYQKAALLYKKNFNLNSAKDQFKYAESLRLSGNAKEAIEIYDQILASDSNALHALEGKSLCYVQNGQFKKAAVLLSKVINKDATKWRAINALGVIYSLTGHPEESLEYYNMALQLSDNSPSVLNNIGLLAAFNGELEKAKEIIEQALQQLDETDKRAKGLEYNLALIYGLSGEMASAEKTLLKHLPKEKVMNNLGFYAKLTNDNALAKTYLSKALSLSPVHYEKAWDNLQEIEG